MILRARTILPVSPAAHIDSVSAAMIDGHWVIPPQNP
jgi:hypothetical protein